MYKHKLTTLKNGLKVVTVPMPQVESMTIMVGVGAGSRYENEKNNGIAHFLEHMVFNGTKKWPNKLAISKALDSIGASFNASTGKQIVKFFVKSNTQHQNLAFNILSDIVLNPKLLEKEIEKEKAVIIEEINMYEDSPIKKVGWDFESLLYSKTPLGFETIGKKENIRKMKRQDFLNFRKAFYFPENMTVVASGKIKERELLDLIDKTFRKVPYQKKKKIREFVFRQNLPQFKLNYKKTSQSHFCLGVRAYKHTHADHFTALILAIILGGNSSSRIYDEIRNEKGLAYYVWTDIGSFIDNGYLVTQASVDINKLSEAVKIILNEYRKISESGINGEELKRAKEFLKGHWILSNENSQAVATSYFYQSLLKEKILDLKDKIKLIEKVTAEDIQRVAKDIFKPEKLNLAVIGPYKDEEKFKKLLKF